jgi:hypothetical protein
MVGPEMTTADHGRLLYRLPAHARMKLYGKCAVVGRGAPRLVLFTPDNWVSR